MVLTRQQAMTAAGLAIAVGLAVAAMAQTGHGAAPPAQRPPTATQPAKTLPGGAPAASKPAPSVAPGKPSATTRPGTPTTQDASSAIEAPGMPTAEEVIKAFEQNRPANTAVQPLDTVADVTTRPGSESKRLRARYPDGYLLIDRPGRLSRDGDWWVLTFESDGKGLEEPPMKLLPNRMLERAVYELEGSANLVFIVSGEVTDYNSENYLLLRKLLRRQELGNISK
jgi:hypothetical protein